MFLKEEQFGHAQLSQFGRADILLRFRPVNALECDSVPCNAYAKVMILIIVLHWDMVGLMKVIVDKPGSSLRLESAEHFLSYNYLF